MHCSNLTCQWSEESTPKNADNNLFLQGAKNLAGDTFDVLFVGTNRGKVCSHNSLESLVCFLSLFFKNIFALGGHNLIVLLVSLFLLFHRFYSQ